jgi:D-alanine transaminase
MPRIAYVNGQFLPFADAGVHIEDRGLQFADSVYEVISCINGVMADMQGHLDRLERSLSELRIDMPVSRRVLPLIIRELLHRNRLKNAAVYIQISRGEAPREFRFPEPRPAPTLIITARHFDFDSVPIEDKGIKVITHPDLRWARRDIKTTNLLPPVLAKQKSWEHGGKEVWLVDDEGYITEGGSSNAWIVDKKGRLVIRPSTKSTLKGVTKTAIYAFSGEKGIEIEERKFTPEEAYQAAEAFSSSATALITPIVNIDGHTINGGQVGQVTIEIYKAYREYAGRGTDSQVRWKA